MRDSLQSQLNANGTMIRAFDLAANERTLQPRQKSAADEKIIEPPTDVPLARSRQWTPPRVVSTRPLKVTERIDKSCLDKRIKPSPLLLCETVASDIAPRVCEIQFRMRHIEIAAENDRLGFLKLPEVLQKIAVPLLPIRQTRKVALGIGDIDIDHVEVLEFSHEHAPFLVMFGDGDVWHDVERTFPRENRDTGIALLFSTIPVGLVTDRPELFDVVGRAFGFLEAQDVRLLALHVLEEILPQHRAQPVDVP